MHGLTGASSGSLALLDAAAATSADGGKPQGDKQAQLREAARQFEALFVKQLLAQIKITGEGTSETEAQADLVNSMWRDRLSQQIAAGEGLGLARMLSEQLGGPAPASAGTTASASSLEAARRDARPLVSGGLEAVREAVASAYAQHASEPDQFGRAQDFVAHVKPLIEEAAQSLGVSPRILLAQAALETGWGRHLPRDGDGQPSRNLFGIKADRSWQGPAVASQTEEFDGQAMRAEAADFRRYGSFAESVRDYVSFLHANPRYQSALAHGGSDENFLQGLKSAGYATDPNYVNKVIEVSRSPAMARYWNSL